MDKTYIIKGMDCASCASLLEMDLEDAGVNAKCSYAKETLDVKNIDPKAEKIIQKIIKDSGFEISG